MEGIIHKSVNAILYGKSTDEKPTVTFQGQDIPNGAKFFEMDTKEVKFYDKDTDSWI
jgi:hypothetical protein